MKTIGYLLMAILLVTIPMGVWGMDNPAKKATHHSYLDVATGHKYIQNMDGTYLEFSRKGELLRSNVPNDLPLLVSNKNIEVIPTGSYLYYEKEGAGKTEYQILKASQMHPQGWRCKDVLMSFRNFIQYNQDIGLGYSQDSPSIVFEDGLVKAIGMAYYDVYTNHRYVKNANNTYTEYSKRGKLLRSDVPNDLPLLTAGWYVLDLNSNDFIVYQKGYGNRLQTRILPATAPHPDGWSSKDALAATQ